MASILKDVTVSQACDFCHHRGVERVKTREAEDEEESLTDEVAANSTTGVKR